MSPPRINHIKPSQPLQSASIPIPVCSSRLVSWWHLYAPRVIALILPMHFSDLIQQQQQQRVDGWIDSRDSLLYAHWGESIKSAELILYPSTACDWANCVFYWLLYWVASCSPTSSFAAAVCSITSVSTAVLHSVHLIQIEREKYIIYTQFVVFAYYDLFSFKNCT